MTWIIFGTQRSGPGTGFSRASFNAETGELDAPELVAVADDPSFFVINPDGDRLFTCNSGTPGGVSAYSVDATTGKLDFINHHGSRGRGPSQLSLDRTGRFVLAANYGGGYVEVVAIEPDGSLGGQTAMIEHHGRSVRGDRQTRPYAHCVTVAPSNQFALVADLGLDQVLVYRFDAMSGALTPHVPPFVALTPGSGPRHLAWHPDGRRVYLIEELSNEVTALEWNEETGALRELQTLTTLPGDFRGESTAAEILVHPNGRFLYASNRGHDSVAVFAIDARAGTLTLVERVSSQGRTPRYLAFDPTGRWLIVANHDSDNVTVFAIDEVSGRLTPAGAPVHVHRPFGIAGVRS
jgi:6-phosphogluconolactonase